MSTPAELRKEVNSKMRSAKSKYTKEYLRASTLVNTIDRISLPPTIQIAWYNYCLDLLSRG